MTAESSDINPSYEVASPSLPGTTLIDPSEASTDKKEAEKWAPAIENVAHVNKMRKVISVTQEEYDQAFRDMQEGNKSAREPLKGWPKYRKELYDLLEVPHSSPQAYYIALVILLLIITSSIFFCVETLQVVRDDEDVIHFIRSSDTVFITVFTTEYIVRCLVSGNMLQFIFTLNNMIDAVAILPFYVELVIGKGQVIDLRFLRLARVFRVFKLSRYGTRMDMVFDALRESKDILAMLSVNLVILVVVFSSLTYFAEKNEVDTPFTSIPATCWWCIVTVLTVGYGDMYPVTTLGQLIATVLMVLSVIVLALPITIIGSCFSNEWVRYKEDLQVAERTTTIPKLFKTVYQPLMRFLVEFTECTDALRTFTQEGIRMTQELKLARQSKDRNRMQAAMSKLTEVVSNIKSSKDNEIQWVNDILGNIVEDLHTKLGVRKELAATAEKISIGAMSLQRVCMAELLANQEPVAGARVNLSEYVAVAAIHVLGAKDLVARDMNGTSDAYVIITSNKDVYQTAVVKRSLNPMFDEHKLIFLKSMEESILFELWDYDAVWLQMQDPRGQFLGKAELSLSGIPQGQPQFKWLDLTNCKSGKLRVTVVLQSIQNVTDEELRDPVIWELLCSTLLGGFSEKTGDREETDSCCSDIPIGSPSDAELNIQGY
ncbi:hypothetical protein CYMTET_11255 [Cymbomonas tetramitiformis]|uniref:C2 domain-containing protein n=1 Tax=Cymbomonas tetramitiformis TaxID=36881 RepID=A0AAE0GMP1_9CHLO|nr:hypothetical protein CYMTET_11255 [Cymbomonas tetramitiformis]